MHLFDTHAHLADPQLFSRLDEVISRARDTGVCGVVAIGTDPRSSDQCVKIANQYPDIYASVGYQPNGCHQATREGWELIQSLATDEKVVAIGETGLDRYWDDCPFGVQKQWFDHHIDLSIRLEKPLVIHMRECEWDIVESLKAFSDPVCGIMHSYTGTIEAAKACLELGLHISFAGMVTFKKSEELRSVAAQIPLDRLLIETDSPYLSPHPKRSQRPNEPGLIQHTAVCLADVFQTSPEELAARTTENAKRLFKIEMENEYKSN